MSSNASILCVCVCVRACAYIYMYIKPCTYIYIYTYVYGPVILDDRMTGQNYLDLLQNELPKQLEGVPLATRIAMYFQHDRAPSH